jgi:predicted small lipoprotein YifL
MMKNKVVLIVFTLIIFLLISISGCGKKEPFVIPVNYSGEAVVKAYTDKTENAYTVKIIVIDGKYSLNIDEGNTNWNISMQDGSCVLYNEKFSDNTVTINNFKMKDSIISEFDLSKFDNIEDPIPEEIIYWDGTYKHVLNFSKENSLPKNIFIYKNENLVKAIEYTKMEIKE